MPGAGTEGPGRGRGPGDGEHQDGPCQQGEAGALSTPSKEEPTPARLPKVPWVLGHMRARPGQGAREAPRGQHGVLRQPWPLILLDLAVGAHGLLPPVAAPRNTAPRVEAPAGKSPWSLWDR